VGDTPHLVSTLSPSAPLQVPVSTAGLVVASVPAGHVYVRHLSPPDGVLDDGPRVHRLDDPDPDDWTRAAAGRWWPPAMLEPQWVRTHARARGVDVFHLHFGFDSRTPAELAAWVEAVHAAGAALVFTVHDLRNPHHPDRAQHDAQLDVLVPAADALVTLTPGAAAEISRRWGREATVVPHPHVVELADLERAAQARARRRVGQFRVGVHVKSVRANSDPLTVLPVLAEVLGELPGAVLQVDAHRDTGLDEQLAGLARHRHVDLRVHDWFADASFHSYLHSLDVSVLPYRFGTHSGWLEACRDVGTTVVAPTCGYYAEQGPVLDFRLDEQGFDPESLARAVVTAYDERPRWGATAAERRAQRVEVAAAHDRVYAAAISAVQGR